MENDGFGIIYIYSILHVKCIPNGHGTSQHNGGDVLMLKSSVGIVSFTIYDLPSLIYICLSNCPFQPATNKTQIIRSPICHSFVIVVFVCFNGPCTRNVVAKHHNGDDDVEIL